MQQTAPILSELAQDLKIKLELADSLEQLNEIAGQARAAKATKKISDYEIGVLRMSYYSRKAYWQQALDLATEMMKDKKK